MRRAVERQAAVQKAARVVDDRGTADRIVALPGNERAVAGDDVSPVQRVVETAPARIGGVDSETGVVDGHDELRTGHLGNLAIDVRGVDAKGFAGLAQIADARQKRLVLGAIEVASRMLAVPIVDLRL